MNVKAIFWIAMAVLVCLVLPIWIVFSIRQQMRAMKRGEKAPRSKGGVAMGNALQELDRLVARPAVEYTVEAETPILKREDDQGGDV